MARASPVQQLHDNAGAVRAPYGPPENAVPVVQTYGELALEYGALRKSAALFDWPHRATLVITGADRLEFLNRMVTQELKGFEAFGSRPAFWLNRKGRIDADLRLVELGDRMLADVDVFAAERARGGLAEFVITEDVTIHDAGEAFHRLGLHGPRAREIIASASEPVRGPGVGTLEPARATAVAIAGREVVVDRSDACGVIGLELTARVEHAREVYERLLEFAHRHEDDPAARAAAKPGLWLRPAGWLAYNTARIEAGTPIYNLDFGPDSLPHESGVLHERVSFKKGCYLGQEVVARMESRGHSKRTLVALRCGPDAPTQQDPENTPSPYDRPLPVAGASVYAPDGAGAEPIGAVTSSTLSPMLGAAAICFAAVRPGHDAPGTSLSVEAEGRRLPASVEPRLRFIGEIVTT